MLLKVNHEELRNVKDVMKNNSNLLDEEINVMLNNLEKLRTIWQGDDSDKFYDNAFNYISRMKTITNAMGVMGEFINNMNNNYEENDKQFSKEIEVNVSNEKNRDYEF